jgi:hypothetical protein
VEFVALLCEMPSPHCEHGRQRSRCKDCGGSGFCEHNRIRSKCKDCGGSGICDHNRERSKCKDCKGACICEHQRERYRCKDCNGAKNSTKTSHGKNAVSSKPSRKRKAAALIEDVDITIIGGFSIRASATREGN